MENPTLETVENRIVDIVRQRLGEMPHKLVLFGSRARRSAMERSDFDLAIVAEVAIDLSSMAALREDLEHLPTLQKIDLVDLQRVSPDFAESVLREGIVLYERRGAAKI